MIGPLRFMLLEGAAVTATEPEEPEEPEIPPTDPGGDGDAVYEIRVRDRRTLALIGYITRFEDVTWQRFDVQAGSWSLTTRVDAQDASLLQSGNVIEIRRNARHEFAGVVRWRDLDSDEQRWRISGPDLIGHFLGSRLVGIDGAESHSGPADLVLKQFVNSNGGDGAIPSRRWSSGLAVPFVVDASVVPTPGVTFSRTRGNLLSQVVTPLARAGDVVLGMELSQSAGYRFFTRAPIPVDASSQAYALSWDTVSQMTYRENLDAIRNAVYVIGPGTGDDREVHLVEDQDSINLHGRREAILDARDATSTSDLETLGRTDIAASILDSITVDAKRALPTGVDYREDYDVGRDVALTIPEAGVDLLVRRIVGIQVTLQQSEPETVGLFLGASPQTLPVLVREALIRGLVAQAT